MILLLLKATTGVYAKTGSLVAGTKASGPSAFIGSATGSVSTRVLWSGTSLKTVPAQHPGSVTSTPRFSGADATTHSRTGSLTLGTVASGADADIKVKTGSVTTRPLVSGPASLPTGGALYLKTGSLVAGTRVSGSSLRAGSITYIKTGALLTGTSVSTQINTTGTRPVPGRPAVSEVSDELYEILKPVAYKDEALGWPLLKFCEAVSSPVQLVKDYGVDWSQILDVDRAPTDGLGWLAQLIGTTLVPNSTDTAARAYIRAAPGFNRGTADAMVAAVKQYLTGTKTVIVRERYGGAYKLQVRTKASETADTSLVLHAIQSQKPGGITLDYATLAGQDYQQLFTGYATYQLVRAAYVTYNGLYLNNPGT